jgi:excisionase family DNA binding protein
VRNTNSTAPKPFPERGYASIDELRAFTLGYLGRTTAYNLIASGQIPAARMGRKILVDAAAARRWWASLPPAATHSRH